MNRVESRLYIFAKTRIWNKLDIHMQEVVHGASVAFTLKVLGTGLAFGFNVLLARMLGAEGSGIYFLALTVTTIASVFGRMGLDNTLLRFSAANAAAGNWGAVKGVYQKGIGLALAASTVSAVTVFLIAPWLANVVFSKPEIVEPLRWMSLAVVPFTLLMLHAELLKGLKRIRDSQLVQGVGIPALSLAGLYMFGQASGVKGAVWAYSLAVAATAVVGYRMWKVATPQLRLTGGYFETRTLLKSSMPLFWVALMNLIMNWAATFILGIWGTSADVGIFGIASRTSMLTSFVLISVNSIVAPKFAVLYNQGDMKALGSTARHSAKLMTLMASPILLLFVLVPGWVMGLFGTQFTGGSVPLAILSVGQFVNVATGSVGYLLIMSGHEISMRNIVILSGVINLTLCLILVPFTGMIGASVATALSLAFMNIEAARQVWLRFHIWTIPFMGR